jgi:hypothetical protein
LLVGSLVVLRGRRMALLEIVESMDGLCGQWKCASLGTGLIGSNPLHTSAVPPQDGFQGLLFELDLIKLFRDRIRARAPSRPRFPCQFASRTMTRLLPETRSAREKSFMRHLRADSRAKTRQQPGAAIHPGIMNAFSCECTHFRSRFLNGFGVRIGQRLRIMHSHF